ncbi:unnamed protein product [Eruca vesicaria subsp. sativa]|uniref:Uncharacterized protein n=1 Tax=Eruca vesicaria subsp. sativa TaxID=29727 RepID=A0ABC8K738_ERUVS|nr:unnamed protein product [Eruca vesicaria subsp. sativa]
MIVITTSSNPLIPRKSFIALSSATKNNQPFFRSAPALSTAYARVRPPEACLLLALFSSLLPSHFPSTIALFWALVKRLLLILVTAREVRRNCYRFGFVLESGRGGVQWSWPVGLLRLEPGTLTASSGFVSSSMEPSLASVVVHFGDGSRSVTVSSVLEGSKRRPGFCLGHGGVPLALSSHPSAREGSLDSSTVVFGGGSSEFLLGLGGGFKRCVTCTSSALVVYKACVRWSSSGASYSGDDKGSPGIRGNKENLTFSRSR